MKKFSEYATLDAHKARLAKPVVEGNGREMCYLGWLAKHGVGASAERRVLHPAITLSTFAHDVKRIAETINMRLTARQKWSFDITPQIRHPSSCYIGPDPFCRQLEGSLEGMAARRRESR
jgi:hypothetical protein